MDLSEVKIAANALVEMSSVTSKVAKSAIASATLVEASGSAESMSALQTRSQTIQMLLRKGSYEAARKVSVPAATVTTAFVEAESSAAVMSTPVVIIVIIIIVVVIVVIVAIPMMVSMVSMMSMMVFSMVMVTVPMVMVTVPIVMVTVVPMVTATSFYGQDEDQNQQTNCDNRNELHV